MSADTRSRAERAADDTFAAALEPTYPRRRALGVALTLALGAIPLLLAAPFAIGLLGGAGDSVVYGDRVVTEGQAASPGAFDVTVSGITRDDGRVCALVTVTEPAAARSSGPVSLLSAGLVLPVGLVEADAEWSGGAPPSPLVAPWEGTVCFAETEEDSGVIRLEFGEPGGAGDTYGVAWKER